jgi:hypothetical protein
VVRCARRIVGAVDIRPGDIVVVGREGRASWGEHVVIAAGAVTPGGTFDTIEGNASGAGPRGDSYEGVVRRYRVAVPGTKVKGFRFGFRPLPGDCISEVFHG